MLKTNSILSLTLLVSIPVCAMDRPPRLDAKPAGTATAKPGAKPAAAPKVVLKAAAKPAPAVANTKSTCAVCFDDKTALETRTLACGHKFCLDCLRSNIQTAVRDKQTQALKCFDPSCKRPIDITDLRKIVYDKNTQNQINDIQLQEWLTQQANIKHCPTPNCHFSFVNERADQFTHKCPDCKAEYCGKCLHPHNVLTSCIQAEQDRNLANDRNAQERANQQWLQQNTRQCPRCHATIEKNGGCNHMTCQKCRYEFCWMCLNDYNLRGHGPYGCSFPPANPLAQQAPQQQEEITLQNAHMVFARDPRGFVNLAARNRRNLALVVDMNFAERFMNLSCEQQGQWTARITQWVEQDYWNYARQSLGLWVRELARLEPVTLTIGNYRATQEGTFRALISPNRELSEHTRAYIAEWIINQNLNDLIIFNGWECETSVSRERLQEILNQANRHLRTWMADRASQNRHRRVLEVRNRTIVSLPNISAEEFIQYADYISSIIGERYIMSIFRMPQPGSIVEGGIILLTNRLSGLRETYAPFLQHLVDEAHNHFALQLDQEHAPRVQQ